VRREELCTTAHDRTVEVMPKSGAPFAAEAKECIGLIEI
jgi:hypothetical protein